MGKKHNKFKKHGGNKHNVVRPQAVQPAMTGTATVSAPEQIQSTPVEPVAPEQLDEIALLDEKYAFIRRDVRKLMIVLGSLVILFIAIYFVNTKTEILANLGDWIYKVGHFSI